MRRGQDFALGHYSKRLKERYAKLTKLNQPDPEETPTTEYNLLEGIKRLAQDWGRRRLRTTTRASDRIGQDRRALLWASFRAAGLKVYSHQQRVVQRLKRLDGDHPRVRFFSRGVLLGFAHLARIHSGTDVPGMLEAG